MGNKKIKLESIKEEWSRASDEISGEFHFSEMIKANVNGPIYAFNIDVLKDDKVEIKFSLIDMAGQRVIKRPIEISSKMRSTRKTALSTWQLDFFDKMFKKNRLKVGNAVFDNKIGISCSNKNIASFLFSDAHVQALFVENKANLLVSTHDQSSFIKLIIFDDVSQHAERIVGIYKVYLRILEILFKFSR